MFGVSPTAKRSGRPPASQSYDHASVVDTDVHLQIDLGLGVKVQHGLQYFERASNCAQGVILVGVG